ncbi:hypothetical protein MACK_001892 [Theileria orientalis]|uniref:Uncharacterized protein n=1 Tax=Theileria orientalis TaxID=68886 RepID=A0A976MAV6_THEOR|nr:hypothetical protein MACK_001892 [Theileria orientalis]
MDSLRSKKVNKKPWIIGGGITALIIIVIIVLCVTLGSSAESGTTVAIKNVDEAFAYIDNTISTTYKNEDGVRVPLLLELRMFAEKVRVVDVMYKAKLEAEQKGQRYDIAIIEKQLLNGRFIEKDGKIEMVLEDLTGGVDKSEEPSTHQDTPASESKLPEKPAEASGSGIPPEGHVPTTGPAHCGVPPAGPTLKSGPSPSGVPPAGPVPTTGPAHSGVPPAHSQPSSGTKADGPKESPETETPKDTEEKDTTKLKGSAPK